MKLVKCVNLMDDQKLIMRLNLAAIPVMLLFFILFRFVIMIDNTSYNRNSSFFEIIFGIAALFGIIVIHELIHGLFFKIFYRKGKVKFGFKNGLAYATSPNSFYTRGKFLIILLSPFVIITLALFILYNRHLLNAYLFVWIASIHAASCIGDFYFSYLVIKAPKKSYIEDTEKGINFYREG